MIEVLKISKCFGRKTVLEDISLRIADHQIYGLIGYNGAGKTTLLKLISGIYRVDGGSLLVDDASVYENASVKQNIFLMTEELFFLPQADLSEMENFYKGYYPKWDSGVYDRLIRVFGLDRRQKISGFSKGMQRQAGILTAFSSGCRYLLLDEAFDGLDLGIRKTMRQILRLYVEKRDATVILTSHNLDELEECADRFGMIRHGKLEADMAVDEVREAGLSLEMFFLSKQEEKNYDLTQIFS